VGSWQAVERFIGKDFDNNVCMGNVKSFESNDNIIISSDKSIVISGLHDIFVVESDNMIFIGKKNEMENIRELKSRI